MLGISLLVIFNIFRLLISITKFYFGIKSDLSLSVIFVSSNKNINFFIILLNKPQPINFLLIFMFVFSSKIDLPKHKAMNKIL